MFIVTYFYTYNYLYRTYHFYQQKTPINQKLQILHHKIYKIYANLLIVKSKLFILMYFLQKYI
jgi:hypothetical protein